MRPIVRLVKGGQILEEREMDCVPRIGDAILLDMEPDFTIYYIRDVIWRTDGHASCLLGCTPVKV